MQEVGASRRRLRPTQEVGASGKRFRVMQEVWGLSEALSARWTGVLGSDGHMGPILQAVRHRRRGFAIIRPDPRHPVAR